MPPPLLLSGVSMHEAAALAWEEGGVELVLPAALSHTVAAVNGCQVQVCLAEKTTVIYSR